MLRGEKTAWVAPWFLRARAAFDISKGMLTPFIASRQVMVREAMPLRITSMNGGAIDFYSADNPQSLYGGNYSKVVVDEASRCPEEIFAASLTVISATNGRVRFCFNLELGSRNWAIRNLLRVQALSPEERSASGEDFMTWPTGGDPEDNLVDPALIEMLRSKMPENLWRSLYLAQISTEDTSLFRNLDAVFQGKEIEGPADGESYICGIDLGRKQDWTVCSIINQAGEVVAAERFSQISWTLQTSRCAALYMQFKCREAHVDASGIGDPIIEEFEKHGMVVKPFVFSQPSRKVLLEELIVACDSREIRLPASGETFRIMRQELEAMECVLDGSTIRYMAPANMHDDCVMSLALCVHGWRQSRGLVLGLLDLLKRTAKEIREGLRDFAGNLLHPAPKPVLARRPVETKPAPVVVDNFAIWLKTNRAPACPACASTATTFNELRKIRCNQCQAVDGVSVPKPVGQCCGTFLPQVVSGSVRCGNCGAQSPPRGVVTVTVGMSRAQHAASQGLDRKFSQSFGRFGAGR